MAGSYKYGGRPSSTQETTRLGSNISVPQRGGATSPSAFSSSSSNDGLGGGALLSAGLSNLDIGPGPGSSPAAYAPPHLRRARNEANLNQTVSDNGAAGAMPSFQLGNVPDDGDVFSEPFLARARGIRQTGVGTPNISAIRTETIDDFLPRTRNRQSPYVPMSLRRTRNIANNAMVADLNSAANNAVVRAASYTEPISYSMALRTTPSESNNRHHVGGVDAQAFYSPDACVFVANLPEGVDDVRLEAEVTRQFSDFGTVFVKIRRDGRNMPFAFCQFTDEKDAKVALVDGKGRMIYGRGCRTETVRANRTYIMHRSNGDDLYEDEARQVLNDFRFTVLERCEPLPAEIQAQQGLGRSILVKLKKFDPLKELQAAFRHHPRYRVIAYDEQKGTQVAQKPDAAEAWLNRYEVDRRSIFIGDLPYDPEHLESDLREVLGELGDVVAVQLITRERQDGREPYTFGFVEFARPDMAALAVERLGGRHLFGREARVERKSRKDVNSRQLQRWNPSGPTGGRDTYQSPRFNRFQSQGQVQGQIQARGYGMDSPETPARTNLQHNQSSAGTPAPMSSYGPPFGGRDWNSPLPNYTTSPFFNQPGSGGYHNATPQMATPQMTTPQMATPYGSQMAPYGYYPATNYSWMSPYIFNPLAVTQGYGQLPMGGAQVGGTQHGAAGDDVDGGAPDTPTRRVPFSEEEA